MGRDRHPQQSLGVLHAQIKQSRVLMVGAGGIGCELLKNLVLTGFGDIHIVDLDTVDLSNLNRQFLFRREHIKRSKALVAKESASRFNSHVKLEAHHANIKDPQFNVSWFKGFDLVFNALDNLEARRHVNRMCLAADVPLIESGTTGFDGQVQVIKKGTTECYDCNTKPTPKSFPVCTIRSTPSQPIHCIVWAKSYLFQEIFGISEEESADVDHSKDSEHAEEIVNLKREAQELKAIRESMGSEKFVRKVFEKVYDRDIERLRTVEDMWKTRKPPIALHFDETSAASQYVNEEISRDDQRTWSLPENFQVFADSLRRLSNRMKRLQAGLADGAAASVLTFDKDDEDTLDFVAAAANLRSLVFQIGAKSKFDIKQMAGNIIPAIATTNAMTAGLCVLQAFKVLRNQLAKARMIFLTRSADRVINSEQLSKPNPQCVVCGQAQSTVVIDPARATLKDFVKDILQSRLKYGEEISISSPAGLIYDPDLEDNLPSKLSDLGVKADTFIVVIDEDDHTNRVNLSLSVSQQAIPEDQAPIILPDDIHIPCRASPDGENTVNGISNGIAALTNGESNKRKRSADTIEVPQTSKRGKVNGDTSKDDIILVDDTGTGAIVIDD